MNDTRTKQVLTKLAAEITEDIEKEKTRESREHSPLARHIIAGKILGLESALSRVTSMKWVESL